MLSRARIGSFLLALTFALAACGGRFHSGNMEAYGSLRIDVTNDLAPRVQIYLLPGGGEPEDLGDAPVEGTTTFRITPDDPTVSYRLRAEMVGGRELLSDPFTPNGIRGVTWVLSTNTLTTESGS